MAGDKAARNANLISVTREWFESQAGNLWGCSYAGGCSGDIIGYVVHSVVLAVDWHIRHHENPKP